MCLALFLYIVAARPELIVVLLGQRTVGLEENAIDVTTKVNLTCQYEEEELVDNVNTERRHSCRELS